MSIEARITIRAAFANADLAKQATSQLEKALKTNEYELASALDSLNPVENQAAYEDATINVEEISRKKENLTIYSYTYTKEEPTWFANSLYQLGANKIYIRGQWDEHGRSYYFQDGKKVSKKVYDGDKQKKPLSDKDIEINKNLFLPDGRVHVKVSLVNSWPVGDIYESVMMEFVTDDGHTFYHKATGKLKELTYAGSHKECEFSAEFERGRLNGEYVSLAKRPTKLMSTIHQPETKTISKPIYPQKRRALFNTKAKCPFCGSSLRTEQAKQCPACLKSWRDE
jgi:hypothetical protein